MALWAGSLTQAAHARDWEDVLGTPFIDPLLTLPPVLDAPKRLAGDADSDSYPCDGNSYQPEQALTLSAAMTIAVCNSPQVDGAWASIRVQAAQVGEARAAYLPTIVAGLSQLRQTTQYPESQLQQDSSERKSDTRYATLTWRLLDFGGRGANRRSADALLTAALSSHDAAMQKTMANVIGLYFEAQTARANREAKKQSEALAKQTLETAQRRSARGAGSQSEFLQAKTSLAKVALEHARAIGMHEKSLVALVIAMGLSPQVVDAKNLRLAEDYHDKNIVLREDLAHWLRLAETEHPAILAARSQLEAARERLAATRSEGLPSLDFTQSEYVNGRPNQGLSVVQTKESVIGFNLNIPLFDGFGRTYKVRGAEAQIQIKDAELRETHNQVLGEVAKAHSDVLAALTNLESSRELLDAAEEALKNVQRKYERGIADILEMLNVQSALADAEQERIRALAEWRSARLRLLANAGTIGIKDGRMH
jgi:outer membrane protein